MQLVAAGIILLVAALRVEGHGRLLQPPSRASAWRVGFSTPPNYNDNQNFCGGFTHQWAKNGGKCGICGDPYDGTRHHEAGGKYATGQILKTYSSGEIIEVRVEITANHLGYFEFRLCPNNDVNTAATQECLDQHLLALADGSGYRYKIDASMRDVRVQLKLPEGLTCTQCVLQWKYNTGNSWGVDFDTGVGCSGCGPQEQFYGCSDVAITGDSNGEASPRPPARASTARITMPTRRPTTRRPANTQRPQTPEPQPPTGTCRTADGPWKGVSGMAEWCNANCPRMCPPNMCDCS